MAGRRKSWDYEPAGAILRSRETEVLARLAADGGMTAMEIGHDFGHYPNGKPAT
ncbi:hypothetical protein ACVIGA_000233 [Bradyrhizobium sp. USDA 3240]